MRAQFDKYAGCYRDEVEQAVSFGGQGVDFYTAAKVEHLLRTLQPVLGPSERLSALDVGCGIGLTDQKLLPHVRQLHGVDIASCEIDRARQNCPGGHYQAYDGRALPFDDNCFDLVFAICVLHHVPPKAWPSFLAEMTRVVRPGGVVAVYEHNPLNPLTRLAVSRCTFDEDAVLLSRQTAHRLFHRAGLKLFASPYILFFPFRPHFFRRAESVLSWLPLGAQYAVFGEKG
jgi:ubiquinone/menaquinone biosynthesis C-methylase UbiE